MGTTWYKSFFSPEYWQYCAVEYSPERTAREISYLIEVLKQAPGLRVADLGCGLGRHAIPLAEAGFEVTGLDVSDWAISEARERAATSGVIARFEVIDLLADQLPLKDVDAAFAIQAFGWGTDADQIRMLRKIRRHLPPNGLLILDFSSAAWILANYVEDEITEAPDVGFHFIRNYDPESGRSRGRVVVSRPQQEQIILEDDVRIYTPAEAISIVREAGFEVTRIDGDFAVSRPIARTTRYVQIVARALQVPPRALALRTYAVPPEAALDLRWAPDEAEWLDPSPRDVWAKLVGSEEDFAYAIARHYALDDPYGSKRGNSAVSSYFDCEIREEQLTFAAGVTSLLEHIAGLARRGSVLTSSLAHPDLPAWAAAGGVVMLKSSHSLDTTSIGEEIERHCPTVVHLDRPGVDGSFLSLDEVDSISEAARDVGALVVVDEAYASYLPPSESAARLAAMGPGVPVGNLIVLRSMSKAYSMGGLRVGFAVAGPAVAPTVREHVPPLGVSEISYRMSLELLAAGDIAAPLRLRIAEVKPELIDLLQALDLEVMAGHAHLPWVLLPNPEGRIASRLLELGVAAKPVVFAPSVSASTELLRMSVPLSEERMTLARKLLGRIGSNAPR